MYYIQKKASKHNVVLKNDESVELLTTTKKLNQNSIHFEWHAKSVLGMGAHMDVCWW